MPDGKPATEEALHAIKKLLQRGFIFLPEGEHANVISFTPPLTITKAQLAKAVAALAEVLSDDSNTDSLTRITRSFDGCDFYLCSSVKSVVKFPAMKLSEMREILAAREIQLTKSLGQNFLHDANQLRESSRPRNCQRPTKFWKSGRDSGR